MSYPNPVPSSNFVPAGWYPDPAAPGNQRWWDGRGWGPSASQQNLLPTQYTAVPPGQLPQLSTGYSPVVPPKIKSVSTALLLGVAGLLIPVLMGTHRLYIGKIGSWLAMLALYGGGVLLAPVIHGFVLFLLVPGFAWWLTDMVRMRTILARVNGFRTPTLKEDFEASERAAYPNQP